MLKPLQTEIRVADLLALVNTQSVKYFLCHNLAYMIMDKLSENEGFAEYMERHTQKWENDGLRIMIPSGCYYYIYENSPVAEGFSRFSRQVVGQLNAYIGKIFPEELSEISTLPDTNLSDYVLELCLPTSGNLWYQEFNFKSRVALLELILIEDPEAVISINL